VRRGAVLLDDGADLPGRWPLDPMQLGEQLPTDGLLHLSEHLRGESRLGADLRLHALGVVRRGE